MKLCVQFALAVVTAVISASHVSAEEPRKNDGWTEPWKVLTIECGLYIGTVADHSTTEWRFVPFQAMGLCTLICGSLMLGIYTAARFEDRDIRAFRRRRAEIRAEARRLGVLPEWTDFEPNLSRLLLLLYAISTVWLYLLWFQSAVETRVGQLDTMRIRTSPPLVADWWWVGFWCLLALLIAQGVRYHRLAEERSLKCDLPAEKEARVLAEDEL